MVVYSAFLDKANKSRQVLRADLTDAQGMMTITLSVPAHLVERHEQKILQGNSISITNFRILPKTVYDRGDCDKIILLNESSIIETVPEVCKEYCFIPNTTIRQFANKKEMYPIGTIAAAVTLAKRVGLHYILHIKDGDSENDNATVCIQMLLIPNFQ